MRKTLSPSKSSSVKQPSVGVVRNLEAGLTWADRVRGKTVSAKESVVEEEKVGGSKEREVGEGKGEVVDVEGGTEEVATKDNVRLNDEEKESESIACEDRVEEGSRTEGGVEGQAAGTGEVQTGDEEEEADVSVSLVRLHEAVSGPQGSWNQLLREFNGWSLGIRLCIPRESVAQRMKVVVACRGLIVVSHLRWMTGLWFWQTPRGHRAGQSLCTSASLLLPRRGMWLSPRYLIPTCFIMCRPIEESKRMLEEKQVGVMAVEGLPLTVRTVAGAGAASQRQTSGGAETALQSRAGEGEGGEGGEGIQDEGMARGDGGETAESRATEREPSAGEAKEGTRRGRQGVCPHDCVFVCNYLGMAGE